MPRTLAGAEPQLLASTDIRSLDVGFGSRCLRHALRKSRTFLGKALLSRISLARAIGDIEPALDDDESDKTNYRPHNLHNGRRLREPEL